MSAGFKLHPAARLILRGQELPLEPLAGAGGVVPAEPAELALRAAFSGPFRIGGGAAPLAAGGGEFESLTSGSSSQPRRIRRSFASWRASHQVNAGLFGLGPGSRVAVLGDLSHSLALYAAIEALSLGAALHYLAGLRPDRQRAALSGAAVTHLYATPAQCRMLLQARGAVLGDLTHVILGGSKLDAALREALAQAAPRALVREFYGAAEASFIALADTSVPPGSVGRPYPGVEIAVRDPAGRDLAEGGKGRIWTRSPYAFAGYAGPEVGGAVWDGAWLSVGEMGWLAQGCLYLSGRAGRMLTIADQNVFPEEIEAFLQALPGVTQAAVLPRPDPLRGHVLWAVLQGDPGQEAAIVAAARAHLGPIKAPRRLVWRQDWPVLSGSGKTDLSRLAAELAP